MLRARVSPRVTGSGGVVGAGDGLVMMGEVGRVVG
jgi:hypothetical protein